jgi:hypothetical protein
MIGNDSSNRELGMIGTYSTNRELGMIGIDSTNRELGMIGNDSASKSSKVWTRKSSVLDREESSIHQTQRPRSFSLGGKRILMPNLKSFERKEKRKKRHSHEWSFASYAFNLSDEARDLKRPDILDVIHFAHYANLAYVALDNHLVKKSDLLVYFSPLNDLFQVPYMVSIDHDWNSIVIAIRGTISTADILVDLSIDTHLLDEDLPQPNDFKVHAGFFQTATHIFNDIVTSQVLEKAMENSPKVAEYHIVVYGFLLGFIYFYRCGHSLGAGVGSLVAYMLRKAGYQSTKCYGYSMPSGVANEAAASLFDSFCLSVVCGDDIVSRLTLASCDVLKNDVDRLLSNCALPKYKIFGSALGNRFRWFERNFGGETRKSLLLRTQNGLFPDGTDVHLQENEINRIVENTGSLPKKWRATSLKKEVLQTAFASNFPPMFIPGRILYIEKQRIFNPALLPLHPRRRTAEMGGGGDKRKRGIVSLNEMMDDLKERIVIAQHKVSDSKYVYTPRWATKEEFMEMIVSRTMISDHNAVFPIMREFFLTPSTVSLQVLS